MPPALDRRAAGFRYRTCSTGRLAGRSAGVVERAAAALRLCAWARAWRRPARAGAGTAAGRSACRWSSPACCSGWSRIAADSRSAGTRRCAYWDRRAAAAASAARRRASRRAARTLRTRACSRALRAARAFAWPAASASRGLRELRALGDAPDLAAVRAALPVQPDHDADADQDGEQRHQGQLEVDGRARPSVAAGPQAHHRALRAVERRPVPGHLDGQATGFGLPGIRQRSWRAGGLPLRIRKRVYLPITSDLVTNTLSMARVRRVRPSSRRMRVRRVGRQHGDRSRRGPHRDGAVGALERTAPPVAADLHRGAGRRVDAQPADPRPSARRAPRDAHDREGAHQAEGAHGRRRRRAHDQRQRCHVLGVRRDLQGNLVEARHREGDASRSGPSPRRTGRRRSGPSARRWRGSASRDRPRWTRR